MPWRGGHRREEDAFGGGGKIVGFVIRWRKLASFGQACGYGEPVTGGRTGKTEVF